MKQATINVIRAKAKAKAEALANEAQQRLVDKYEEGLGIFYGDYTPKQYVRTYNFRDNSYSPFKENTGTVHYGGIEISERNMNPYKEKDVLFDILFNPSHTWHGKPNMSASFVFYDFMYKFQTDLVADFRKRCEIKK